MHEDLFMKDFCLSLSRYVEYVWADHHQGYASMDKINTWSIEVLRAWIKEHVQPETSSSYISYETILIMPLTKSYRTKYEDMTYIITDVHFIYTVNSWKPHRKYT
jgi:hypothetical protein